MFDVIVRGGTIVDGSGGPGFLGDVAVKDGRIVAVGQVSGEARRVVDATGRVVAPALSNPDFAASGRAIGGFGASVDGTAAVAWAVIDEAAGFVLAADP